MKENIRGHLIDVEKVKELANLSGFSEVKAYHERSLGLIANAKDNCTLNAKQVAWLKRLSENVDNQYREEIGK